MSARRSAPDLGEKMAVEALTWAFADNGFHFFQMYVNNRALSECLILKDQGVLSFVSDVAGLLDSPSIRRVENKDKGRQGWTVLAFVVPCYASHAGIRRERGSGAHL
jgi:hypothetical protein